jgi:hypothetical protein
MKNLDYHSRKYLILVLHEYRIFYQKVTEDKILILNISGAITTLII